MRYTLLGFLFILSFCFIACQKSETADVSNIKVNTNITRLDESLMALKTKEQIKAFLKANPELVQNFYQTYPEDTLLINRLDLIIHHPAARQLYEETQKSFGNLADLSKEFEVAFKHIKFYYPQFKEPKIVSIFSALDNDLYVSDSLVVIPLESFLGPKARYRPQYPTYLLTRYDKPYIVPSVLTILSKRYNRVDLNDRSLLADMIYYGKSFEFTRTMIPNIADSLVIAYPDSSMQQTWNSQQNVWAYMLENKLLYETNDRIKEKYIGDRPKVVEIGAECPGRIGQWIGWRIVSRYRTENPSISLIDLMKNTSARDIFEKSKYKGQTED